MNTVSVGMGASRKITENGQRSNKKYVVNILRKEGTMRTILLCILISVLSHWAWGQDNLRDSCWQSVSVDSVWTPHEIHMARWYQQFRPLLDAYKFYSDECWADSTEKEGWVTHATPVGMGMYSCYQTYEEWWSHREPTFTGFMEFLKRKVKP